MVIGIGKICMVIVMMFCLIQFQCFKCIFFFVDCCFFGEQVLGVFEDMCINGDIFNSIFDIKGLMDKFFEDSIKIYVVIVQLLVKCIL